MLFQHVSYNFFASWLGMPYTIDILTSQQTAFVRLPTSAPQRSLLLLTRVAGRGPVLSKQAVDDRAFSHTRWAHDHHCATQRQATSLTPCLQPLRFWLTPLQVSCGSTPWPEASHALRHTQPA